MSAARETMATSARHDARERRRHPLRDRRRRSRSSTRDRPRARHRPPRRPPAARDDVLEKVHALSRENPSRRLAVPYSFACPRTMTNGKPDASEVAAASGTTPSSGAASRVASGSTRATPPRGGSRSRAAAPGLSRSGTCRGRTTIAAPTGARNPLRGTRRSRIARVSSASRMRRLRRRAGNGERPRGHDAAMRAPRACRPRTSPSTHPRSRGRRARGRSCAAAQGDRGSDCDRGQRSEPEEPPHERHSVPRTPPACARARARRASVTRSAAAARRQLLRSKKTGASRSARAS